MFKSPANLKSVLGWREATLLMNEGRSFVKLSYIIRGVASAHQPSSVSSVVTGGRKHACLFKCLQTVHLPLALRFHPACLLWAEDHRLPLAERICPNTHPILDRGIDCLSLTMRAATVVSQRSISWNPFSCWQLVVREAENQGVHHLVCLMINI